MAKIFVVEDNSGLRDAIVSYLEVEGHTVFSFDRVSGVHEAVAMAVPQLLILDVMLPDGDGFHLARNIRREYQIPILFLTARSSESDRITGFELGADDYVTKPFSMRELVLRVRALLSRVEKKSDTEAVNDTLSWQLSVQNAHDGQTHSLSLNTGKHLCMHDSEDVKLTATEWKILEYLAMREDTVVSRERLLGQCLDYIAEGSERAITTHMKNIRAKLGEEGWIETVRGFGYRFIGKREL
jgi:two-component system phosphate regulon response regulator PhoB